MTDIAAVISSGIDAVFTTLETVKESVTVHAYGPNPDWSISDGDAVQEKTEFSDVEMIPTNYKTGQIDGEKIQQGDIKGIIKAVQVDASLRTKDVIIRPDLSTWVIQAFTLDVSKTVYILQLREQGA